MDICRKLIPGCLVCLLATVQIQIEPKPISNYQSNLNPILGGGLNSFEVLIDGGIDGKETSEFCL